MPAPYDFGRTKKKEPFQSDLGKESKTILIMEFKVHSGEGKTLETGSVPELPQKNTSSQDCSECGWNSIRQSQLLLDGMCKRKPKENLREQCTEREVGKTEKEEEGM